MKNHLRRTAGDWVFDITVGVLVALIIIATLYPVIYTFSMAISNPIDAARGNVWLLPVGFDLTAVQTVLSDNDIWVYYGNTLWYTVMGTLTGIITTSLLAYPLSRPEFKGRGVLMRLVMVTMFFGGGMIPSYIVISKYLHLYNNRLALILPALTTAWYVVVARSFFETLPSEIIESARIDGASEYRIFLQLVLPLSKPVIAVLALYLAVSHWNGYFDALLYLGKKALQPLSLYIRSVVVQSSLTTLADAAEDISPDVLLSSLQIKYAVILVSVVPMLAIYPFLSGYLEKGLLVGSLKG